MWPACGFFSHHGIWLVYRLILICWIIALSVHMWLFYLCVCVCVHMCTCLHVVVTYTCERTWLCETKGQHWILFIRHSTTCDLKHGLPLSWNPPTRLAGWPLSIRDPLSTMFACLCRSSEAQTHVFMPA